MVTTFRESPEAARRLCLLLGSSRALAEAIEHNPELIAASTTTRLSPRRPAAPWWTTPSSGCGRPGDERAPASRLVRLTQDQTLRIATRDLLGHRRRRHHRVRP